MLLRLLQMEDDILGKDHCNIFDMDSNIDADVSVVAAVAVAENVVIAVAGDVALAAAAAGTAGTLYHLEDLFPVLRCYFQNQRLSYRQSL